VELSGEVVDSPQAVITAQVEAGVVVRMAVLFEVLAGARAERAAGVPAAGVAG
jgi:aspartate carbamoyltransferase catalytic subunit